MKKLLAPNNHDDEGISLEHEQELCNILGTHDTISFFDRLIYGKGKYVVDIVKTQKALQFLDQYYILPQYYSNIQIRDSDNINLLRIEIAKTSLEGLLSNINQSFGKPNVNSESMEKSLKEEQIFIENICEKAIRYADELLKQLTT